jgi:hypothetical protein
MTNRHRPRARPATSLASASHQDDTMNKRAGARRRWLRERPRRARVAAVITVMAAALLAAACGGSLSPTGSPSSTGSGGSPNAGGSANSQLLAFARCVRTHGVPNFPDPDRSGHFPKGVHLGVSDSVVRAGETACQSLLPAGFGSLTAPEQQDYLMAAACMRSHGITNFPDPTFSGGGVNFPIPSSIDTKSRQFTEAAQTCTRLIPAGLPYSRGSGG